MTQINQDVSVFASDSCLIFVMLTGEDGAPLDASTLDEIEWRMATSSHSDALIAKTLGDGIALAEGGVQITLSSDDTNRLPGTYHHTLKTYDGEAVSTAMVGAFVVRRALPVTGRRIPAIAQWVGQGGFDAKA